MLDQKIKGEDEYNRITRQALILKKVNLNRYKINKSAKINKNRNKRLLENRKKRILEENRRKMLEIQWRLRLAQLSTSMHKEKIKNIGW